MTLLKIWIGDGALLIENTGDETISMMNNENLL